MKINIDVQQLCISPHEIRGIQNHILNLLRSLLKRGVNEYHVSFFDKDEQGGYLQLLRQNIDEKCLNVIHINECATLDCQSITDGVYYNNTSLYDAKTYSEYIGVDFDLLHFPLSNYIPRNIDKACVVTVHDIIPMINPMRLYLPERYVTEFENSMHNIASNEKIAVITVSEATKNDLLQFTSISENRIFVVPNGYDNAVNYPDKNESVLRNLRISSPYLFFLAAHEPHKGILDIIDAFDIIKTKHSGITLLLGGQKSNIESYNFTLKRRIERSSNKDDIIQLGFISEIEKRVLMSCAEAFLFPSEYEGFGFPVLEAMACGSPVITTNVSSLPEVCGDAALYVSPRQPELLAYQIERLLDSRQLCDDLVTKGLVQASKFSWDENARLTEEVYRIAHDRYRTGQSFEVKAPAMSNKTNRRHYPMINQINENLPTVLYGAGKNAKNAYEQFLEKGIQAVCFVDKDPSKWGNSAYEGCPIDVCSLDEATNKYGDYNLYITVGSAPKYSIMAYLTEDKGVPINRIINYEPYIKRKSCILLETTIAPLGERDVGLCRGGRLINVTQMPTVKWTDDAVETLDSFMTLRNELLDEIQTSPEKSPCDGCIVLREQMWPADYRVKDYVLSTEPSSICQFKCMYCYAGHYGNSEIEAKRSTDIRFDRRVDLLLELEKRGLADPEFTTISLSDGELCIDPKKDNLFALAERYKTWIYTNAGVYSETIASLLDRKKTFIVVSVDAGTRETFKKVKNADVFDKVCENLRRYSRIDNMRTRLQYIFLPGINDSIDDIEGFVALCTELKTVTASVLLDVLSDRAELPPEKIARVFNLLDMLLRNGIKIFTGGNVSLTENERQQLWDIANSIDDGLERDSVYYERLSNALNEKVY
ncbi:MAG: glycosyltransferase [Oscillospiraceae bacterium]|nr:glycosyltransferase [Oscillospiraceae bacterium]